MRRFGKYLMRRKEQIQRPKMEIKLASGEEEAASEVELQHNGRAGYQVGEVSTS